MTDQPSTPGGQPDTPAPESPAPEETAEFKADAKVRMVKVAVRSQVAGPGMNIGGVLFPWPNPSIVISQAGAGGVGANAIQTVLPFDMALVGGSDLKGRSMVILAGRQKQMPFCELTGGRDELDERHGQNFKAFLDYYAGVEAVPVHMSDSDWKTAAKKTWAAGLKAGAPGYG